MVAQDKNETRRALQAIPPCYLLRTGAEKQPLFSGHLQKQWPSQLWNLLSLLSISLNLSKSISESWIWVFVPDVSWLRIRMMGRCTAPSTSRKHRKMKSEQGWVPNSLLVQRTTVDSRGDTHEVIHVVSQFRHCVSAQRFARKIIYASFLPFEILQKYHAKIKMHKTGCMILPCTVSTNSLVIFPATLLATHI